MYEAAFLQRVAQLAEQRSSPEYWNARVAKLGPGTRRSVWLTGSDNWCRWEQIHFGCIKLLCSNGRVLDVGCGFGRLAPFCKSLGLDYVGIDNSEAMIAAAKIAFPDFLFQLFDGKHIPFEAASFDAVISVICSSSYGHNSPLFIDIERVINPIVLSSY